MCCFLQYTADNQRQQSPTKHGQTIQWPKVKRQEDKQSPTKHGQTIQWPKVKRQEDKQSPTKHARAL
jgi:hypothetical protein